MSTESILFMIAALRFIYTKRLTVYCNRHFIAISLYVYSYALLGSRNYLFMLAPSADLTTTAFSVVEEHASQDRITK